jgi:hypothetical protein
VNLPGVVVDLPTLTEKDVDDITNWGVANEIDFIAASFVRKGRDLDEIREVLGDKGRCVGGGECLAGGQGGLTQYLQFCALQGVVSCARGLCVSRWLQGVQGVFRGGMWHRGATLTRSGRCWGTRAGAQGVREMGGEQGGEFGGR